MSERLPVGETINEAFRFGVQRWSSVIRFGWLPAIVSMLIVAIYLGVIIDFGALPENEREFESFEQVGEVLRLPVPMIVILGFAVYAMIFVLFAGVAASIFRLAALGEENPGIFHLRFDGPAKRVFFAYFTMGLIGLLVWGVAFFIGLSLSGSSFGELGSAIMRFFELAAEAETREPTPEDFEGLGAPFQAFGWAVLFAFVPMFYISIKLVPFAAGSAAENRLLLFGSFRMTSGHFWSIFGLCLLMLVVVMLTASIFEIAGAIINLLAEYFIAQGSLFALVGGGLFALVLAASVFYNAFIYAFQLGLQAIIYRRLKTGA